MPQRRPAKPSTPTDLTLTFGLDEPDDEAAVRARVARALRVEPEEVGPIAIVRRSIDARGGHVTFQLRIHLGETAEAPLGGAAPREVAGEARVAIIGDGPAGLFAAYQLARAGVACTVFDRGKPVRPRRFDLKGLQLRGEVNPDSNYCFGEGGAGTYSDGKLYTRSVKRGSVRDVLEILVLHGASDSILVDARPHIGSNRLPSIITAMREHLEQCGVRFVFGAKLVALRTQGGEASRRVAELAFEDGSVVAAQAVVIATGHSARDVFTLLLDAGIPIEPKPFALGVRIEHPQPLINRMQYGSAAEHPRLPSAYYSVKTQVEGRGVFSFCMCPGGWIVPASTESTGVVVNGMSMSRRNSPHANSGLVVAIEVADWEQLGFRGPLGGVDLQRTIEEAAARAGGGNLCAPAARVSDFVAGRASSTVPPSSYRPGLLATDLSQVLDVAGLPIAARLREALRTFGRDLRGFVTDEAVLVGVESRTSAPVRIPRDPETLESTGCRGLYPAGEGAGYAGGIVSAALDGMRIAESIVTHLGAPLVARAG